MTKKLKEEEKVKLGRKKIQIDYRQVEALGAIMCSKKEIAAVLGCCVDTLDNDPHFSEHYEIGKEKGKMSLRRMQFELAKKNANMAIWLGKQILGQSDQLEITAKDMPNIQILSNVPKIEEKKEGDIIDYDGGEETKSVE